MKKIILRWGIFTWLFCLSISCALANSWGLTGDLYALVSKEERWNDYSTITKQQGDFAVLGARYHNVLMQAKDDRLFTYPLAVYQPDDGPEEKVKLSVDGNRVTLSYAADESFVFQLNDPIGYQTTGDVLVEAQVGHLDFKWNDGVYLVTDGASETVWQRRVDLDEFNIKLFPRTLAEVRHLNHLYAALDSGIEEMDLGASSVNIGKGTIPVYSAPYGQSAWRAANGKAAVGLSGQHWRMGTFINEEGEAYTKIRYEVSERTQRIGYVRTTDLNTVPGENCSTDLIHVLLEARADTYLTDDPLVSQFQQFYVPPGTQFVCMGTYGEDYAYVSAEVRGGKFTDGGQIIWGFVPLRDLTLSSADGERSAIAWDVMANYAGEWYFSAGGNQAEDILILNADGTYRGYPYMRHDEHTERFSNGTWQLTRYNPAGNLYWAEVPYEITFFNEDGYVNVKGFWPNETGFSLLYWEGSGGYDRLEEPFAAPADGNG